MNPPLLTREELLRLSVESLIEKVLGLRQDLVDDAEEIAMLRAQLSPAAATARLQGAEELAKDCEENDCASAAAIVRAGLTPLADAVRSDLLRVARDRRTREAWALQLDAWAAGHDELIVASNAAWGLSGCACCAVAVLRGTRCAEVSP